jgi:hypothetical protein
MTRGRTSGAEGFEEFRHRQMLDIRVIIYWISVNAVCVQSKLVIVGTPSMVFFPP